MRVYVSIWREEIPLNFVRHFLKSFFFVVVEVPSFNCCYSLHYKLRYSIR